MKTCIIWRGLAGSGKSTIDEMICRWWNATLDPDEEPSYMGPAPESLAVSCCTDDYWWLATCSECGEVLGRAKLKNYDVGRHNCEAFVKRIKVVYKFEPDLLHEAHKWNFQRFQRAIEMGTSLVTVPNTNYAVKYYQQYVDCAKAAKYRVFILSVDCSIEDALQRQKHSVPEHRVRKQALRWEPPNLVWVKTDQPGPIYRPVCPKCHRVSDFFEEVDQFACSECGRELTKAMPSEGSS